MADTGIQKEIETALNKNFGAVFYKCALQVNSSSYASYRGKDPMSEEEYNQAIVENCKNGNIQVVGLADHGDVESSESLRKCLQANGFHVFPGFELCSSEKVHMVCLFPEEYSAVELAKILGNLDDGPVGKKKTAPSTKSTLEIAKAVFEKGGVWYAAHMTSDNGLLKLQQDGGGLAHIWQEEKCVVAGQIPAKRDELEQNHLQIVKNQNPNYKRENLVSLINAKDVAYPEDILHPAASCMIKMTKPSIEALKQAFLDGDSRIRLHDEIKDYHQSQLIAFSVTGGFLDGVQAHFSENLNALIGGRGTGKSTIIEGVRYALGLVPKSVDAKKKHDDIIKGNFANSRILLQVYSHHLGRNFKIERYHGQDYTVYDHDGNITHQEIADLFPGIEILGQNEIYDIAEERNRQLELLNRFLPIGVEQDKLILRRLAENRNKLVLAVGKKEEAEAELNQMNRLKEQQDSFRQFGLDKKFNQVDQYEKEKNRIIRRSLDDDESIAKALEGLKEAVEQDQHYLTSDATDDLINKDLIENIRKAFERFFKEAQEALKKMGEAYGQLQQLLGSNISEWEKRYETFEKELKSQIEKLPDMAGKSGSQVAKEYMNITKRLHAIQKSGISLKQQEKYVDELRKQREKYLTELQNFKHERFTDLQRAVNKLNKKHLKNRLKIEVRKTANRTELKDFLLSFPGVGKGRVEWIDLVEDLTVKAMCDLMDEGEDKLMEKFAQYGMTAGLANKLANLDLDSRLRLEELQLFPEPIIQLNVNPKQGGFPAFKQIEHLSTGQKCTAILHLLLLDNPDPLLIDQPEDNLDNAFIAEQIVADLRKFKMERQFLFSTHNANIPVFGDAEWMGVLEADEDNAYLKDENVGSIDSPDLREKVEDILEGGKRAFEIRRLKYGF